jgi:hypothetical protein
VIKLAQNGNPPIGADSQFRTEVGLGAWVGIAIDGSERPLWGTEMAGQKIELVYDTGEWVADDDHSHTPRNWPVVSMPSSERTVRGADGLADLDHDFLPWSHKSETGSVLRARTQAPFLDF